VPPVLRVFEFALGKESVLQFSFIAAKDGLVENQRLVILVG
jgi:hypothetical protein